MATCKDCLHYCVCTFHITENEYKRCPHYDPIADVVEVVRCKDCTWWEARTYGSTIGRCENPCNGLRDEYVEDADFCSYGKRKEGE